MLLRNPVLLALKGLPSTPAAKRTFEDEPLHMDQVAFRALYEQTARPIWLFLLRRTGSDHVADDLLQETYYRFLRTPRDYDSAAHRRNYLFKIASNVANDALRRKKEPLENSAIDADQIASSLPDTASQAEKKTDLARAMKSLPPHQRDALWLAYAEGATHAEIADILNLRPGSIKPLLFRARARLACLLRDPHTKGAS